MKRLSFPLALACVLLATGCGGPSLASYDEAQACGVDTSVVTDLVGTDEIEVDEQGTLPLGEGTAQVAPWTCAVDTAERDDVLSVTAKVTSPDDLAARTKAVEEAPEGFEAAGGQAGMERDDDSLTAQWVCGTTSLYVTAGPVEPADDKAAEKLVTALAEAVGCPG